LKLLSLAGLGAMLAALLGLWEMRSLFSPNPVVIGLQLAAVLLMIWARVTFGLRSFHAAANPTAGGLIMSGPYHFIRHPIYASICLFLWAGVMGHFSLLAFSLGALGTAGAVVRMLCEEHLLVKQYPEYRKYAIQTRRLLPGLW
jgi:protein-S-isoprenylcysteine O-methyltransferase Ste14